MGPGNGNLHVPEMYLAELITININLNSSPPPPPPKNTTEGMFMAVLFKLQTIIDQ